MSDTQTSPAAGTNWKGFLLRFAAVYVVAGVAINLAFGPPTLSKNYLADHKADQDRYIETIKMVEYKRWSQRPKLNPPDEALAERIAFVQTYTASPEFIAEQRRRGTYGLIFDLFNVGMLVFLVAHFARTPVRGLLDGMIESVRATLDRARDQRTDAARRQTDAKARIDELPERRSEHNAQTTQRIEEMRREAALATGERLAVLNRETEDRRRYEEILARQELKRDMVDQAIAVLSERYRAQQGPEQDAELIDRFMHELGDRT